MPAYVVLAPRHPRISYRGVGPGAPPGLAQVQPQGFFTPTSGGRRITATEG